MVLILKLKALFILKKGQLNFRELTILMPIIVHVEFLEAS